jgi:hypothetical protein
LRLIRAEREADGAERHRDGHERRGMNCRSPRGQLHPM